MTTPYLVLARKYRPQRFSDLTGQEHVVRTLVNALKTGRVAHAFLFTGPRGCGKTTSARILARALNCEKGPTPEPCGVCGPCVEIAAGNDVDFEDDYVLVTGGPAAFLPWREGEPNNANEEDCVELVGDGLNDRDCDTLRAFVCECE